jgi:hypothetical protein
VTERLVASAAAFVGGGVVSLILLGLVVSVFDLNFQSVWHGAIAGAVICCIVGFCFPKLGSILIEFVD